MNLRQSDSSRNLAAALAALAAAEQAVAAARALLAAAPATGDDPWVKVTSYLSGVVLPRIANAACASGEIEGATKQGGRSWKARRSAVDAWMSRHQSEGDEGDLVERWTSAVDGGSR